MQLVVAAAVVGKIPGRHVSLLSIRGDEVFETRRRVAIEKVLGILHPTMNVQLSHFPLRGPRTGTVYAAKPNFQVRGGTELSPVIMLSGSPPRIRTHVVGRRHTLIARDVELQPWPVWMGHPRTSDRWW
jgi:hypothetical protein